MALNAQCLVVKVTGTKRSRDPCLSNTSLAQVHRPDDRLWPLTSAFDKVVAIITTLTQKQMSMSILLTNVQFLHSLQLKTAIEISELFLASLKWFTL
jgi:hypothetical protein